MNRIQVKMVTAEALLSPDVAPTVGEILGQELRSVAGVYFGVPRIVGDYYISVYATDSVGCTTGTTLARLITVF